MIFWCQLVWQTLPERLTKSSNQSYNYIKTPTYFLQHLWVDWQLDTFSFCYPGKTCHIQNNFIHDNWSIRMKNQNYIILILMVTLKEILFRKVNATVALVSTFITFQLLLFSSQISVSLWALTAWWAFSAYISLSNKKRFCSVSFCHSRIHYIFSYTAQHTVFRLHGNTTSFSKSCLKTAVVATKCILKCIL